MIPYKEDFTETQKKAWETMKGLVCLDCAKEYKDAGMLHKLDMGRQAVFGLKQVVPNGNLAQVKEALGRMTPQQRKKVRRTSTKQLLAQGYSQEVIDEAFQQAGE
jgi:hypothetical protein